MGICRTLLIWAVAVSGFFFPCEYSYAQPVQLFLDPATDAAIGRPLEIEILALNENGDIDQNFMGEKEMRVTVQEGGAQDQSYFIRSKKLVFNKGRAFFTVENSEEEVLDVAVALAGPDLTGRVRVSFEDKDIFPPEITAIHVEDPDMIKLEFNEDLDEESAQKTRNYKAVMSTREVFPESIEYHKNYVYLKFAEHFHDREEGYIELDGILDLRGNEVASGLRSPDFVGVCSDVCSH